MSYDRKSEKHKAIMKKALNKFRKEKSEKWAEHQKTNYAKWYIKYGAAWYREYYKKYKKKVLCRTKLQQAIRMKKIKRGICEICKNPKTEGHHTDYNKPLEVIWLCKKHHLQLHNKLNKKI